MDYELLEESEHAYKLKDPKGKEIQIAKQAISDALHQKIKSYAKGGKVPESLDPEAAQDPDMLSAMLNQPFPQAQQGYSTPSPDEIFSQRVQGEMSKPMGGKASQEMLAGPDYSQAQDKVLSQMETEKYQKSMDYDRMAAEQAALSKRREALGLSPLAPMGQMASIQQSPMDSLSAQAPVQIGGEATPQGKAPGVGALGQIDPMASLGKIEKSMFGAAEQKYQAEKQYAQETLAAHEEAQKRSQEVEQDVQRNMQHLQAENQKLFEDFASGKIEPNRLWNSAATGSKIAAGIGLILGGIGAGLTGGQNQALQMLNKLVDQDIDAQKMELGKKQTLFSMNLQKTRDVQAAAAMTKAQIASALQGQIAQAAARAGTKQAESAKLQAVAQIEAYKLPLLQAEAQRRTLDAVRNHIGQTGDLSYINAIQDPKVREDLQGRAVPGYGLALNPESAKKANEKIGTTNTAIGGIKDLLALADKGSSLSLDDRTKANTTALMLKGALRPEIIGPGAASESEWKLIDSIIQNPVELTRLSSTAKTSLNTLMKNIERNRNANLVQYGLKPKAMLDLKPLGKK